MVLKIYLRRRDREDEENTVDVCLRIIALVVEEFKPKAFARKTILAS